MPEAVLPIERDTSRPFEGVVCVTLEQPGKPVVVLDEALISDLGRTLERVPGDARGLVLRSASERVFVAGADLKSIYEWDDDRLHAYLRLGAEVFGMLASFPFPTCAAINGAALGGGLEVAMHCDGLVAAPASNGKAYPIGLPEAGLGLCPGWGGTNLLPARMDAGRAIEATAGGAPLNFETARDAGLFDAVAETPGDLIEAAKSWVVGQGRPERDGAPMRCASREAGRVRTGLEGVRGGLPDTGSARAVVGAVEAGLSVEDGTASAWGAALEYERDRLVALRHEPEARSAIEAFFARSSGGGSGGGSGGKKD